MSAAEPIVEAVEKVAEKVAEVGQLSGTVPAVVPEPILISASAVSKKVNPWLIAGGIAVVVVIALVLYKSRQTAASPVEAPTK